VCSRFDLDEWVTSSTLRSIQQKDLDTKKHGKVVMGHVSRLKCRDESIVLACNLKEKEGAGKTSVLCCKNLPASAGASVCILQFHFRCSSLKGAQLEFENKKEGQKQCTVS